MNWRIVLVIAAAVIIALTSCSEQKRCARFAKRHPACFNTDTVWHTDTIKGFTVDTVFSASVIDSSRVDTFTLVKDNVVVKTVIKWKDRIVYQNVQKSDTVVRYATVYKSYPVSTKYIPWWVYLVIGVEGLVILLLAIGRVKSK